MFQIKQIESNMAKLEGNTFSLADVSYGEGSYGEGSYGEGDNLN